MALHWQILLALVLGIGAGVATGTEGVLTGLELQSTFDFIGTLFINSLKMIIVPLIVTSIINGVANIGGGKNLGRLGAKTISFYFASSAMAILTGLLLVNLFSPGTIDGKPAGEQLGLSQQTEAAVAKVEGKDSSDLAAIFLRMIPTNVVAAAAEGQMLGLIFFSVLFGVFLRQASDPGRSQLTQLMQTGFDVMMSITLFIMRFAPLGVFALVANTVAETGFASFRPLATFFITVVLALFVHAFIVMPLVLRYLGKVDPFKHLAAMSPALLTAFSSASSSATLPLTMECMEQKAGVSNRTSSFVLPLGATINMDGTALYECVAAMFIAQAYGIIDLSLGTQFTVVVIALLTSIGVAGIPAASLVAITIILTAIGLPLEAIGLILVTDRVLDMFRTAVNVWGDSCAAAVIARSEGEAVPGIALDHKQP